MSVLIRLSAAYDIPLPELLALAGRADFGTVGEHGGLEDHEGHETWTMAVWLPRGREGEACERMNAHGLEVYRIWQAQERRNGAGRGSGRSGCSSVRPPYQRRKSTMTMLSLVPWHGAAVVAAARTSSDGRGVRARFRCLPTPDACWLAMRFSLGGRRCREGVEDWYDLPVFGDGPGGCRRGKLVASHLFGGT